jgi:hypothetical protein
MATLRVGNKRVTLKLSVAEVDVLATILMHVGGPPQHHRGLAASVLDAILDGGANFDTRCADVSGSIYLDASPNGPRGTFGL